ncbi:penicillin-binding protein 1C [bacterium]|nr:penicillin-binding protein 1C [bacterium]
MELNKKSKKVIFFTALIIFILSCYIFYPLPKKLYPPLSKTIRYNNGKVAHVFLASDEQYRLYIPLKNVPVKLQKAMLEKEDRYFYLHPGFNPISLVKAMFRIIKYKHIINGGSTITMQLARITEPKKRTVLNKFLEILRAIQFEIRFSKKKILEYYLNYAPFGKNIVGVEAASFFYFGKPLEELNLSEITILANLPQIPGIDFLKNTELLKKKRNRLLTKLVRHKIISKKGYKNAIIKEIDISYHRFPRDLKHLSDYFYLYNKKTDITTTVDEGLQKFLEDKINNHKSALYNMGITNCSTVLMDIKTGNILAITGSLDYHNKKNEGEVRGFTALRQPGSTLKPFLYGYSIDHALITPATMLKDIPLSFKDFTPANFDNSFRGLVNAETALSHSLNIPFVRLLKKAGKDNFVEFLKGIGFDTLRENNYYGLSLILGACEVNILELTNAFRIFPNYGTYSPYHFIKWGEKTNNNKIMSKGAAFLTMKALSIRNNPDIPRGFEDQPYVNKIKWKTGTSKNYKDAWTIGFGYKYALGVWAGNFNGKSSVNIVGAKAAAPIFFDIIGNLEKKVKDIEETPPDDITLIKVCPVSGKRVSTNCPNFIYTQTIKNNEYMEMCNIHQKLLIEKKSGLRITSLFSGVGELESKVFVVFPADVKNYIQNYAKIYPAVPPIHPKCFNYSTNYFLNVISPKQDMVYLLTKNGKLPLTVFSKKENDHFFWFVDGKFYKKTDQDQMTYLPMKMGNHTVEVINDDGAYRKIIFDVVF